jgi:hypothetical protein
MTRASPLPYYLPLVYPKLTMDVITLIVQFTQDIENPDLWHTLSIDPFHQEDHTETLKRIQALLRKGLVSKLWQDAILDPTLWTTFLNAGMAEEKFLRVVARVGDLLVTLSFKPQNSTVLSDQAINSIVRKSSRIAGLLLDIANATPSPMAPALHLRAIMNLLKHPMSALRTLSVRGAEGPNPELSVLLSSEGAFGGVMPSIQHLELSGIAISPCTFGISLVSLTLVYTDVAHIHAQLSPWVKLAQQGDMPALKELILRALPSAFHNELPEHEDTEEIAIPNTLDKLIIEGDIPTCIYMGTALIHPIPVAFDLLIHYYRDDSEHMWLLGSLFADMRASMASDMLDMTITDDTISFGTMIDKDATLTFVPANPKDAGHMLCCVLSELFSGVEASELYELCGAPGFENTWVTFEFVLHQCTLLSTHDDDELPQILESFATLFQKLEEVQNVQIAQYVILGDDSIALDPWEDSLRLFQPDTPEGSAQESALLFPNLKALRIAEPPQGIGREYHRAVSDFTWEHLKSQTNKDEGAGFEYLEILPDSGDISGFMCESSSVQSRGDWDLLCARACGLDSTRP